MLALAVPVPNSSAAKAIAGVMMYFFMVLLSQSGCVQAAVLEGCAFPFGLGCFCQAGTEFQSCTKPFSPLWRVTARCMGQLVGAPRRSGQ